MHKEAKVKFIDHLCKFFLSFSLFCFFKISRDLQFELKILNFIFCFYCLGYYKLFWLNLLELLPLLISVLSASNLVIVLIDKDLHNYFLSEGIYNSKFNASSFSSLTQTKDHILPLCSINNEHLVMICFINCKGSLIVNNLLFGLVFKSHKVTIVSSDKNLIVIFWKKRANTEIYTVHLLLQF